MKNILITTLSVKSVNYEINYLSNPELFDEYDD